MGTSHLTWKPNTNQDGLILNSLNTKPKYISHTRKINNDFEGLMEQTYKMNVKNHITKADAINEQVFNNQKNKVYGILYDLKGNTASAVQFYVTDSCKSLSERITLFCIRT